MLVTSHQNPPHLTLARGPSPAASKILVGQGLPLALRDQRDSAGNQPTSLGRPGPEWTGLLAGLGMEGDEDGWAHHHQPWRHGHTLCSHTVRLLTLTVSPFATFLNPRPEPDALQLGPTRGRNHSCIIWTPCPSHPPQLRGFPEDNALLLCCSSLTFG